MVLQGALETHDSQVDSHWRHGGSRRDPHRVVGRCLEAPMLEGVDAQRSVFAPAQAAAHGSLCRWHGALQDRSGVCCGRQPSGIALSTATSHDTRAIYAPAALASVDGGFDGGAEEEDVADLLGRDTLSLALRPVAACERVTRPAGAFPPLACTLLEFFLTIVDRAACPLVPSRSSGFRCPVGFEGTFSGSDASASTLQSPSAPCCSTVGFADLR